MAFEHEVGAFFRTLRRGGGLGSLRHAFHNGTIDLNQNYTGTIDLPAF